MPFLTPPCVSAETEACRRDQLAAPQITICRRYWNAVYVPRIQREHRRTRSVTWFAQMTRWWWCDDESTLRCLVAACCCNYNSSTSFSSKSYTLKTNWNQSTMKITPYSAHRSHDTDVVLLCYITHQNQSTRFLLRIRHSYTTEHRFEPIL